MDSASFNPVRAGLSHTIQHILLNFINTENKIFTTEDWD